MQLNPAHFALWLYYRHLYVIISNLYLRMRYFKYLTDFTSPPWD
jgi:hypothetical protein